MIEYLTKLLEGVYELIDPLYNGDRRLAKLAQLQKSGQLEEEYVVPKLI